MNLDDGKLLVNIARSSISSMFSGDTVEIPKIDIGSGVFVNILMKDGEFIASRGVTELKRSIGETVSKVAKMAAFNETRPIKQKDLNNMLIEVCILNNPELLIVKDHKEYFNKIELGKHGVMVECEGIIDLLLPRVAIDHNLDVENLLSSLCDKAGLLAETWKEVEACKIFIFTVEIFKEIDIGVVERG